MIHRCFSFAVPSGAALAVRSGCWILVLAGWLSSPCAALTQTDDDSESDQTASDTASPGDAASVGDAESTDASESGDASESADDSEPADASEPAERAKPAVGASDSSSVDSAHQALGRWWGYPWYNRERDQLQPIEITPLPTPSSWWLSWLGWFGAWFPWLAWGTLAICVGLLVLFVVRAYLDRERGLAKVTTGSHGTVDDVASLEALPFDVRRPTGSLLDEARRQYEQGNYAEAIIYLFSHRLLELDRHQMIRLAKGKTNRQYLREVGAGRALGQMLARTTGLFEATFFGRHSLGQSEFEVCWNDQAEFDNLLASPAVAVET